MPNSSQFKSQTSLTVGVRTLGPSRHCCEFPSGYTKRGPPQRRATLNSMESWITSTVLGEKHPCFLLVWHHDLKNFYQFSFHDSTDSMEQWRSTMPPQSKHGWPWQSLDADLASEVRHGPSSSRKTITIVSDNCTNKYMPTRISTASAERGTSGESASTRCVLYRCWTFWYQVHSNVDWGMLCRKHTRCALQKLNFWACTRDCRIFKLTNHFVGKSWKIFRVSTKVTGIH